MCSLVDVKLPGKIPSSSAQLGHNFHHEERYSYQSGRLCAAHACDCVCRAAYAIGKKERPPFVPQEKPMSEPEEDPVPDELLCLICRDLLSDAVVIPCCGNSYCDDCESLRLPSAEMHIIVLVIDIFMFIMVILVLRYPYYLTGFRGTHLPHM